MIRLGVTGTDTGVGKTTVAVALLAVARGRGLQVAAMKPVETGIDPASGTDARRLAQAAGGGEPADVCPYGFGEPLAPLVAGRRAGRDVDLAVLDRAFARLAQGRDVVIVEGAGGLLVPLAPGTSYAELFERWRLGVVVVAENRLGALNHVLLTTRAAEAAGLAVRGVVLNAISEGEPDLAQRTNAATLAELLPGVRVFQWPRLDEPLDMDLGPLAERTGLATLLENGAVRAVERRPQPR